MKPYQIDSYKKNYPPGTTVELVSMEDDYAVPAGTKGAVKFVDDIGTLHVDWENGRTLGICPDVDHFRKIDVPVTTKDGGEKASVSEQLKAAGQKVADRPANSKENPQKGNTR